MDEPKNAGGRPLKYDEVCYRVQMSLPGSLLDMIDEATAEEGLSRTEYVVQAVRQALKHRRQKT